MESQNPQSDATASKANLATQAGPSSNVQDYVRPEQACYHCQAWQLDCIINRDNLQSCYPCTILLRDCNLSSVEAGPSTSTFKQIGVRKDDTGSEDESQRDRTSRTQSPASRPSQRLPKATVKFLEAWVKEHITHPYPTDSEREGLQQSTGLTRAQVSNWFANYRRKSKAKQQKQQHVYATNQHAVPVDIPRATWESLDPLERWRNSPPETEPAHFDAINDAVNKINPQNQGAGPSTSESYSGYNSGNDIWQQWRSPSSAGSLSESYAVSNTSAESVQSARSARSGDSRHSSTSMDSKKMGLSLLKHRRKRRNQLKRDRTESDVQKRRFQCTFCTDRFKSKYDWMRHEKTLHISLENWTCPGQAKEVQDPESGTTSCAFCDALNPTAEHVESHTPAACGANEQPRIFLRKDHLQQHLRLAHHVHEISKNIERWWRSERTHLRSRCGFCNETFTTWEERASHLSKEFRDGAEMRDWKGSRGFDAAVESQLTFAMPPYLVDIEARSLNPFSASNPVSILQHREIISKSRERSPVQTQSLMENETAQVDVATYWDTFALQLEQWARRKMEEGVLLTDEMLQMEGRIMVFGSDDSWNQTEADHPDWLEEFKRTRGIVTYPLSAINDMDGFHGFGTGGAAAAATLSTVSGPVENTAANVGLTEEEIATLTSDWNLQIDQDLAMFQL